MELFGKKTMRIPAIASAALLLGLATPAFPCSVRIIVEPPKQGTDDNALTNPVQQLLQAAFIAKNPKVTRVRILELRATGMGAGPYILLGWGIRPDSKFEGVFDDELFGVFVLDNTLTKIERTIDIFPTCRWADCFVSIERVSDTEVVVVGAGSYGDMPFRKAYPLHDAGARR